jgi:tRNA(Ile2) C34 agmatinyltransferase TiaS
MGLETRWKVCWISHLVHAGVEKLKKMPQPKWLRRRKETVQRVASVVIDQPVTCSTCNEFMRLTDDRTFTCTKCGAQMTLEEACKVLHIGEA